MQSKAAKKWFHADDKTAILADYGYFSADNGKHFERRYLVIHRDFALYIYRAHAVLITRLLLAQYCCSPCAPLHRAKCFCLAEHMSAYFS